MAQSIPLKHTGEIYIPWGFIRSSLATLKERLRTTIELLLSCTIAGDCWVHPRAFPQIIQSIKELHCTVFSS